MVSEVLDFKKSLVISHWSFVIGHWSVVVKSQALVEVRRTAAMLRV